MKGTIFDTTPFGITADTSLCPLDVLSESIDLLTAEIYKVFLERTLGTRGGKSDVFGENGLTLQPEKALIGLEKVFPKSKISQRNLAAIKFLDKWFSEPDNLGGEFWWEFDSNLESNRFRIP